MASVQETIAGIESLNKKDQPFSYSVQDNMITGYWKYLDVDWAAPLAKGKAERDFKVAVTLHDDGTYTSVDNENRSRSGFSVNPTSGKVGFGMEKEFFKGQKMGKSFGFTLGKANQPENETGTPIVKWNFSTEEIKRPLFDYVEQHGWTRRKTSFWDKLLGRSA